MIKPYLITGGNGILGKALDDTLYKECYCLTKAQFNVLDFTQMFNFLNNHHGEIKYVIHCAAITSIVTCEENKKLAYDINVLGIQNLLTAINSINEIYNEKIKLIHVSTGCVFSGEEGNYDESSLPYPKNYYGLTKLIAEELVRYSKVDSVIFRTNFVERGKWKHEKAFSDRYGTYLYADQVAQRIIDLKDEIGILHITGDEKISMYQLAKKTNPDILPISLKEYTGKAKLCQDMSMISKTVKPIKLK